ncbi:glycosyltransferase family A protein [Pseudarthrobacter sp. NIBRBAC000502771]|uniref:glycosyltransferase family 2 protein n=1 Tax=Pseudarthrobacter sp. NIBRBAC000502771 TaxID=2590774 RepID=UPI00113150BC|nr:glycosyltransferase family A protein [Pseudarthrobacter sp. NIBRBAC000502771]QDG61808.1 glycosyltransferase [Pseudarthrobacter sp. NIBRBAC000502771]
MLQRARSTVSSGRLPHVAVVVPCYNYGRYLQDCIESIISQPQVTTNVHILDDASTDGSVATAEQMVSRYPNVRLSRHTDNRGHIATYNEGLSQVDSDYVVLLSADDMLAPGSLSRAAALMEANPQVGLVYGHPQAFTTSPHAGRTKSRHWSVWPGPSWISAQFRRGLGIIASPEAVVRTSIQHRVGYYRPELPHSGDLEMWLRIADVASVGRINGVDQAYRRVHNDSMMQTSYGNLLTDLEERVRAYKTFLMHSGLNEGIKRSLLATVCRRMAIESLRWATIEAKKPLPNFLEISKALQFSAKVFDNFTDLNAYQSFIASADESLRNDLGLFNNATDSFKAWRGYIEGELGDRLRWRRWRIFGI